VNEKLPSKLIVVTGVPGSGTTTVVKKALEKAKGYRFINYGDIMFDIAKRKGLISHRDEIRKLDQNTQRMIQKKAAEEIAKIMENENVILDTHCTVATPKGYLPGLPEYILRILKPNIFVIIEANPDEILGRRLKDTSRKRDITSEKEIQEHQQINRSIATSYCMLTGATLKILKNHNDRLDECVNNFLKLLED